MTGHPWLSPFWLEQHPQKPKSSRNRPHASRVSSIKFRKGGHTTMSRVDEYRRYAAECLRIAQETSDPEAKARLLNMAQKWRELGKKAEEGAADDAKP